MTLEISRIGVVMAILALMVAIIMGSKSSRRERSEPRPVQARPASDAAKHAADRFARMKQARQEANYETYKAHGGSK